MLFLAYRLSIEKILINEFFKRLKDGCIQSDQEHNGCENHERIQEKIELEIELYFLKTRMGLFKIIRAAREK